MRVIANVLQPPTHITQLNFIATKSIFENILIHHRHCNNVDKKHDSLPKNLTIQVCLLLPSPPYAHAAKNSRPQRQLRATYYGGQTSARGICCNAMWRVQCDEANTNAQYLQHALLITQIRQTTLCLTARAQK